jgi:hypothetical protein
MVALTLLDAPSIIEAVLESELATYTLFLFGFTIIAYHNHTCQIATKLGDDPMLPTAAIRNIAALVLY